MRIENKNKIIQDMYESKIVAILRGVDEAKASHVANALFDGGVRFCEVTFQMKERDNGFKSTLNSVRSIIAGKKDRNLYVGVGTVLTTEQVILARDAGAEFIITPTINVDVIKLANQLGMMTMPGGYSPTELEVAWEAGADFVKIFPASEAGPSYFKAVSDPLAHIPLVAVGGVTLENEKAFLDAGVVGFGIGGGLVNKELINNGDYKGLTELAKKYVAGLN